MTLLRNKGHVHMGSQVPSPESQVLTFEPQATIEIWVINIKVGSWLFYAKVFAGLVVTVGSSFSVRPNSQHKSQASPPKSVAMLASMSSLGLGTLCEVVSPNFRALNGWDCTDRPRVTWDFRHGALRLQILAIIDDYTLDETRANISKQILVCFAS